MLALAGTGALLAACARDNRPTFERIRESGALRVGISGEEPYSYLDTSGRLTGESPEVAKAVMTGFGVQTLESVQRPFGKLIDGLLGGSFDVIASGMQITRDRCRRVLFSRPDFVAPTAFLVRRGNPLGLRDFGDVARAGVPIAVLDGAVERGAARAAGVRDDRIKAYDSPSDLYQAVFDGAVPVATLTDISLRRLVGRHPASPLEVTPGIGGGRTLPAAGFAFRPADADLCNAFSTGLTTLQNSGAWLRIAAPFGVSAANLPPRDLTTADACQTG